MHLISKTNHLAEKMPIKALGRLVFHSDNNIHISKLLLIDGRCKNGA